MLLKHGFTNSSKVGKTFDIIQDIDRLMEAIKDADQIMESAKKQTSKVRYRVLEIYLKMRMFEDIENRVGTININNMR